MKPKKIKLAEVAAKAIERNNQARESVEESVRETVKESTEPKRNKITLPKKETTKKPVKRFPAPDEPFSERYTRVTTYLDNNLHTKIKELKKARKISSITVVVNTALEEFFDKHNL